MKNLWQANVVVVWDVVQNLIYSKDYTIINIYEKEVDLTIQALIAIFACSSIRIMYLHIKLVFFVDRFGVRCRLHYMMYCYSLVRVLLGHPGAILQV